MSPWRPLCDFQPEGKEGACLQDAPIEVVVSSEGQSYRALLCRVHGQALINAGEPTTAKPSAAVTKLPRVGPKRETVDQATKAWALSQGGDTAAAIHTRGRQSKELREQFLASPQGKVWAHERGE